MADSGFSFSLDEIKQMSRDVLKVAKDLGASSAEAELSLSIGQNVSVRLNEVENIEYNRDKGMSVSVYFGQQKGHASTSDLSPLAI
jgi:PmbA protein